MLVICCFNIDQFSKWPTNSQNEEKYTDEGYLKVVKGTSVSTSFLNSANKILYNNDILNLIPASVAVFQHGYHSLVI